MLPHATAHSKASFASLATDAAASFTAVPAACAEPRARSSLPGTGALLWFTQWPPTAGAFPACLRISYHALAGLPHRRMQDRTWPA
jgi:hypothetical protein